MSRPCDGLTSVDDVTDDARMTTMTFMAVKHYNPQYFSQSGRIEQELALTEGDIVRRLGNTPQYPRVYIVIRLWLQ